MVVILVRFKRLKTAHLYYYRSWLIESAQSQRPESKSSQTETCIPTALYSG